MVGLLVLFVYGLVGAVGVVHIGMTNTNVLRMFSNHMLIKITSIPKSETVSTFHPTC